jgi:hypothetical protein
MWVLSQTFGSHAADDDILFAYDDVASRKLQGTKQTYSDLIENATAIYPWIWSACWTHQLSGSDESKCMDAELPFLSKGELAGDDRHWRSRYLHITPFVIKSTVYFLMTTLDEDRAGTAFVVRPMPNAQYTVTCILNNF